MRVTINRLDGTTVVVSGDAAEVLKRDLDNGMTFPSMKDAFADAALTDVPQEKKPPQEQVIRKK